MMVTRLQSVKMHRNKEKSGIAIRFAPPHTDVLERISE